MGLFDKFRKKADPEPTADNSYELWINIPEKSVKVELTGNMQEFKDDLRLEQVGNSIKMMQGNKVLYEVGNRAKAYKELELYVPYGIYRATVAKHKGDYGYYYRSKILFKLKRTEGQRIAGEAIARMLP